MRAYERRRGVAGRARRAVKNVFPPFFQTPDNGPFFFLRFPTAHTPTRRDIRRAWPTALNVRDTETTPVVYVRVLIHDTHDKAPPSAHIHDNATTLA